MTTTQQIKPFFLRLGWPPPGWALNTPRARAYRNEFWNALTTYPLPNFRQEALRIEVKCCPADGRQYQYFGLVTEAAIDAMTYCNTIESPRQIQQFNLIRGAQGRPGYLDIFITPLEPSA